MGPPASGSGRRGSARALGKETHTMDALTLARIQFAFTAGFHLIFPPISIGLAWLLVIAEWFGWRKGDAVYTEVGKFFGKLFAITFATGVATGIVMEFQFGTTWAAY